MPLGGLLPYGPLASGLVPGIQPQMAPPQLPPPMGGGMMPPGGGPMMPGAGGGGMMPPGGAGMAPGMGGMPGSTPIQNAGEQVITKLLEMAAANPQLLLGLSLAGAAREVSQLSGLSRRRQGGQGKSGAPMPAAQALLSGNQGDIDRLMALQTMLGGGAGASAGQPPTGGGPLAGPAMSPMLQMLRPQSAGVV